MKLMAIIGSPRKGGNTEVLVDQVIEGCKSTREVEVEKFFVIDKKIEPLHRVYVLCVSFTGYREMCNR